MHNWLQHQNRAHRRSVAHFAQYLALEDTQLCGVEAVTKILTHFQALKPRTYEKISSTRFQLGMLTMANPRFPAYEGNYFLSIF